MKRSAKKAMVPLLVFAFCLMSGCGDKVARKGPEDSSPQVAPQPPATAELQANEPEVEPSVESVLIAENQAEGLYSILILHKGESTEEMVSAVSPVVAAKDNAVSVVADVRDRSLSGVFKAMKFDPETAPTPLVMVLAPNSVITGVFTREPSAKQLGEAILPEQPLAVRQALLEGKHVIVKMQTDKTVGNEETDRAVEQFLAATNALGKYVAVSVRMDRPENAPFLRQLKIDPAKETQSIVLGMAPPLKIVNKPFRGLATKDAVEKAVNPACASRCAAGST